MTRFNRDLPGRLERDLSQISDRATPSSSTAWETIRNRIDEQDINQPTMEVIVLDPETNKLAKRPRTGMLVAASVAALALIGGLFVIANRDGERAPADRPDPTVPEAIDGEQPESDPTPAPEPTGTTTTGAAEPEPSPELPIANPSPSAPVEEWSMNAVGPGTFTTSIAEPGFTLTYPEGWVPYQPETKRGLNIEIPESSVLGCSPCAFLGIITADGDSVSEVVDFGIANGVEFGDPEDIEVGGIPAQRYEVIGGEGLILETEFSVFGVDSAEGPARVTYLEVDDRVIVIVELGAPNAMDVIRSQTDAIITSIEWSIE